MSFGFTAKKSDANNGHPAIPVVAPANGHAPAVTISSQPPVAPVRTATRTVDRAMPSMIGPDVTIIGNLVSSGELQIDGEVQGDLHGSHIVVGERARIDGGVVGDEVVIRGQVNGSVRGRKVMLQASSHVEGDVHHQSFAIEQGAFFEGKSRRTDDPLAGIRPPSLPAAE
jgi:cytoskeletal protein CcmA (bactofilin family)